MINGEEEILNPDGGNSPGLEANNVDDPQLEMEGEIAEMEGGMDDGAISHKSGTGNKSQAEASKRGGDEDGNGEEGSVLGIEEDKGDAEGDIVGDDEEEKKSVSKKEEGE